MASKFGKLLKGLKILPDDHVISVTGTSLQGQYVGETKEKVLKAMRQARGGILFIDEAYGMAGGQYTFANEIVDTLVGTITQPEFKGNMLVIMAGYEDLIDQMFAAVNPGFRRSRRPTLLLKKLKKPTRLSPKKRLTTCSIAAFSCSRCHRGGLRVMFLKLSFLPSMLSVPKD